MGVGIEMNHWEWREWDWTDIPAHLCLSSHVNNDHCTVSHNSLYIHPWDSELTLLDTWHMLQKPAPEIGPINLMPDSAASFLCQCKTSNVTDCLHGPKAVNDVRSRRTMARKTGAGIWHRMAPIFGVCVRGLWFPPVAKGTPVCGGPRCPATVTVRLPTKCTYLLTYLHLVIIQTEMVHTFVGLGLLLQLWLVQKYCNHETTHQTCFNTTLNQWICKETIKNGSGSESIDGVLIKMPSADDTEAGSLKRRTLNPEHLDPVLFISRINWSRSSWHVSVTYTCIDSNTREIWSYS